MLLKFQAEFYEANESSVTDTLNFVHHWIHNHVLTLDREYVPCFHEHGL